MNIKFWFKKITIYLSILVLFILIVLFSVIWFVFTPGKLTPFIKNQLTSSINCKSEIEDVELTFFSTFPEFGVKINNLQLINPTQNASNDTLLNAESIIGIVDVSEFLFHNKVIIKKVELLDTKINAFVDKNGKANFDIVVKDSVPKEESEFDLDLINLKKLIFKNVNINYTDLSQKVALDVNDFNAEIEGLFKKDFLSTTINIKKSIISCQYEGIDYLNNLSLEVNIPVNYDFVNQVISFKRSEFSINENVLQFDGKVSFSDDLEKINTNINYSLNESSISNLLSIVPQEFKSSLKGIDVSGYISTKGTIKGEISSNKMPVFKSTLSLKEFALDYPSVLSTSIKNVGFYCDIETDFSSDSSSYLKINSAKLNLAESSMYTEGLIKNIFSDLNSKLKINTSINLANLITLFPKGIVDKLEGVVTSTIESEFNINQINHFIDKLTQNVGAVLSKPKSGLFHLDMKLKDVNIKSSKIPFSFHSFSSNLSFNTDFIENKNTELSIDDFKMITNKSTISLSAKMKDLFGKRICIINTKSFLNCDDFVSLVPKGIKLMMAGKVDLDVDGEFYLQDILDNKLNKIKSKGNISFAKFFLDYEDYAFQTDFSSVNFKLTGNEKSFMKGNLKSSVFNAKQKNQFNAKLINCTISFETSDITNTNLIPIVSSDYYIEKIIYDSKEITLDVTKPNGKVTLSPKNGSKFVKDIKLALNSEKLSSKIDGNYITYDNLKLNTSLDNDDRQQEILSQWLANGNLSMSSFNLKTQDLNYPIQIPTLSVNFSPEKFSISECDMKINNSTFSLKGDLWNIFSYITKDSLLKGDFLFQSSNTDINELMNLTSGIGEKENVVTEKTPTSSDPYLVPKGIDIQLHTAISKAKLGGDYIKDISGDIRIKDGVMVLKDLLFTTQAAKMKLTAMYKTPRRSHLFIGMDYYMYDIDINKLVKMIPDMDSIMPMLSSFSGKAEYHLTAETYLDANYNPKKSTIRAASSLKAKDLVVLDGPTFKDISKKLMFNNKTKNKIDSLSVEFTVFKNEIDIYPFVLKMDKYKTIIEGRHNLDMSFNYHIYLVESPIPFSLGLGVLGNIESLRYKFKKSKYSKDQLPTYQYIVENKGTDIRKIITDALINATKTNIQK